MTQERRDNCDTPFGRWLRNETLLSSDNGYRTTDIDYLWENRLTGEYMFIEEKRSMKPVIYPQNRQLAELNQRHLRYDYYRGFHVIQFEKQGITDGEIYLDGTKRSEKAIIKFLRFEAPEQVYTTVHNDLVKHNGLYRQH